MDHPAPIINRTMSSEMVLEDLNLEQRKTPANAFFMIEPKKHAAFETVEPGLAKKGNGTRIYARVCVNKNWTWRSTKTSDLVLARTWREKWNQKQWLERQGYVVKEPSPDFGTEGTCAAKKGNGQAVQPKIDPKLTALTVNDLFDNYVAAGQPIIIKRKLKRKAPRSIKNETYYLVPLRAYFGAKVAEHLTLGDCDGYASWRKQGGYVSQFTLHGRPVTKKTPGGERAIDLHLGVLSNALELGIRQGHLKFNPIRDRGQYYDDANIRHCREVAPTPAGLVLIVDWLEANNFPQDANITRFLAYTGLRLGEGLKSRWSQVDWPEELIHVKRSKKGVFPFVLILPELATLLRRMEGDANSELMFPSPFDANTPRDDSSYRRRLGQAAAACGLSHVTPQGLRSYFVTQARQSGLTDAEIAQLIGDKTGPSLIAEVYGDVRPDHLLAVARKIQLTAKTRNNDKP